jgi:hypothetical protein
MAGLGPLAEEAKRRRQDRPDRLRAPGAGQKGAPLWMRLLVALTHLRQGTALRATGAIFGVDEKSVRNWRDEIEGLLVDYGLRPPGGGRRIRSLEDLAAYLDTVDEVMVDATEIRRSAPGDWEAQRQAWSGKSHGYAVKATVVADAHRRPIWFEANPSGEGRTHDATMLRGQKELLEVLIDSGVTVHMDKAYRGLHHELGDRAQVPLLKTRRQPRTDQEKTRDRRLSTQRMPIEHAIGRMKWWRALHYWRRPIAALSRTGKAIAVLATLT